MLRNEGVGVVKKKGPGFGENAIRFPGIPGDATRFCCVGVESECVVREKIWRGGKS